MKAASRILGKAHGRGRKSNVLDPARKTLKEVARCRRGGVSEGGHPPAAWLARHDATLPQRRDPPQEDYVLLDWK